MGIHVLCSATEIKVPARGKALVPTDLSIAIPEGTYARVGESSLSISRFLFVGFFFFFWLFNEMSLCGSVAPRSGLAWKHSIDVGAGVIDADYRGPVGVILFNHADVDFEVKAGDRIAQLIIEKIMTPDVMEVEDLDSTVRGEGGFGSTGV
jgi:dUTP pyrophosphatase